MIQKSAIQKRLAQKKSRRWETARSDIFEDIALLPSNRLDRQLQFAFRLAQMRFRSLGVASHVVTVSRLNRFYLMNRFVYVFADLVNVVPVMNPLGNG
jgi:hypothetical protein